MSIAPLILRVDTTLSGYPWALGLCSCNLKSGLHCLISSTRRRKREHPCGLMAYTPTVSTLILWVPLVLWAHFQRAEELDLEAWKNSPQWGRLVPSVTAPKLARRATNLPFTANAHTRLLGKSGNTLRSFILFLTCMLSIFGLQGDLKKIISCVSSSWAKIFSITLQLRADNSWQLMSVQLWRWTQSCSGRVTHMAGSHKDLSLMRSDLQLKHGFSNSHRAKAAHIVQPGGVHF